MKIHTVISAHIREIILYALCRLHPPKPAIKTYTRTMYGTLKAFSSHHNISASMKISHHRGVLYFKRLPDHLRKEPKMTKPALAGWLLDRPYYKKKEISRLINPPVLTIYCTVVKVLPLRVSNRNN